MGEKLVGFVTLVWPLGLSSFCAILACCRKSAKSPLTLSAGDEQVSIQWELSKSPEITVAQGQYFMCLLQKRELVYREGKDRTALSWKRLLLTQEVIENRLQPTETKKTGRPCIGTETKRFFLHVCRGYCYQSRNMTYPFTTYPARCNTQKDLGTMEHHGEPIQQIV